MAESSVGSEMRLARLEGVQLYAHRDEAGRPNEISAIHEDRTRIDDLADRLQQAGYGVLRERNPRSGRIYYRLRATWPGPGAPPEAPLGDDGPQAGRDQ